MSSEIRFLPNTAEVAAEVLDGEAVIINLTNGMYYSLSGTGGFVWTLLEGGANQTEIVAALRAQYRVGNEDVDKHVQRLVDDLKSEGIIMESSASGKSPQLEASVQNEPYEAPRLKIYGDMQDLLALDPPMPDLTDVPWK